MPLILFAYQTGPDAGYVGVPGENGTCATGGCHLGGRTTPANGTVSVTFADGSTYTPGRKQHVTVTVTEQGQRRFGFEMTARLASNTKTKAGTFLPGTDRQTQLLCSTNPITDIGNISGTPCTQPFEYIEHTMLGTVASNTKTFEFDWMPPDSNVGTVTIYVAMNAANGDGNADGQDHIYTRTLTLTAAGGGGNAPQISDVQNGASFVSKVFQSGSWVTIKGTNLTSNSGCNFVQSPGAGCRLWEGSDFVGGVAPTQMDGVSVTMGGKPAYVEFITPTQINVQAPDGLSGNVDVVVKTSAGTSNTFVATAQSASPAFFAYEVGGVKNVVATHLDGTIVGSVAGTTPAKPGETVVLWGTGFGAVAQPIAAGHTAAAAPAVTTNPTVTIDSGPAQLVSAVLNGSFLGVYQIAITIPQSAGDGDRKIVASVAGFPSPSDVVIAIKK